MCAFRAIHALAAAVGLTVCAGFVLHPAVGTAAGDGASNVQSDDPTQPALSEIVVYPNDSRLVLRGKESAQQLLVAGTRGGRTTDETREARFRSLAPEVVEIDASGWVRAVGDGRGTILVEVGDVSSRINVEVRDAGAPLAVTFERDVMPILGAGGCNSGACHGKARGQNGFALSLLGFNADFDFAAIVKNARGRRIFPAAPDESLLLRKPSARVPHGGGLRLPADGEEYAVVRRWIALGTPRDTSYAARLVGIRLDPPERTMTFGDMQQLLVTAEYSDGTRRDVTRQSAFQSNEAALAAVDELGRITAGGIPGEATIMARYMGHIATYNVAIPLPGNVPASYYADLPVNNEIDRLVYDKLALLGITVSEPAAETTFLRRAYLDLIGRPPRPDEVRAFVADDAPDKRERVVDALLDRPEYADYWANKWADLLRPNPYRVGIKATLNFDAWIRDEFRRDRPYDEFVRDLVTAQGSTWHNGATTLYRDRREPDELTTMVSQLFLGVRLECAKCHHHPFEVWGQDDFYSFAAYFARVGRKGRGVSPPISGSEEMVYVATSGSVKHPVTGETLDPRPLFGEAPPIAKGEDPRRALARWITSPENPYFAEVAVNRIWADMMGRGLVDPVDDLRATNPPSNGPLLEYLADEFRRARYDQKAVMRLIANSYVYGLSSQPTERNVSDTRNYSRHYRKRLRAEVLLDAISDITGIRDEYDGLPPESRAVELWTHRAPSRFLDTFGRPDPNQDPPCQRTPDTSVVQALHLMNSPELHAKVTGNGSRVARLAADEHSAAEIVEELYLLAYNRFPDAEERAMAVRYLDGDASQRRRGAEDLLWAMINSPEFVFED